MSETEKNLLYVKALAILNDPPFFSFYPPLKQKGAPALCEHICCCLILGDEIKPEYLRYFQELEKDYKKRMQSISHQTGVC